MAESFDMTTHKQCCNFWPLNSQPALQECGLCMIWKEIASKNLNLENIKFYTCSRTTMQIQN